MKRKANKKKQLLSRKKSFSSAEMYLVSKQTDFFEKKDKMSGNTLSYL